MDRDRERRAPPSLDYPLQDAYRGGRGQSYRPGGAKERSPVRGNDTYRARSPPRRSDMGDSYRGPPPGRSPPRRDTFRRRSPSPARFRDRDSRAPDIYRARPRSPPPRREDLPRDDLFRRDVREEGEYVTDDRSRGYGAPRSPPRFRDRSPVPSKRGREASPVGSRGQRSPPPMKRERLASPPRGRYNDYPAPRAQNSPPRRFSPGPRERIAAREYGTSSRSPLPRSSRPDLRNADDWRRPRSPSPQRQLRLDAHADDSNGRGSGATSRRSSPPIHPSRLVSQPPPEGGVIRSRELQDAHYQSASPASRRPASPLVRETSRPVDMGYGESHLEGNDRIPPPREPGRADMVVTTPRAPPTGPSGQRAVSASTIGAPTGPAAASPPLGGSLRGPPTAPSGPRGAPGPSRGDAIASRGRGAYRGDFSAPRGGFGASFRGGRGGAPPSGPGFGRPGPTPSGPAFEREIETPAAPPSGPRGSSHAPPPPAFRANSSTSTPTISRNQRFGSGGSQPLAPESSTPTGPRAYMRRPTEPGGYPSEQSVQRQVGPHPAIADLPKVKEGGEKAAPIIDRTKLDRLEDEAEKLRKVIEEKEVKKRKSLREWDRLTRETTAAAFRTQVAEEALRSVSGEAESTAAF